MGFNYSHTCPDIDKHINEFKEICANHFSDLLSDASPLIEGQQKTDIIKQYVDWLYNESVDIFEGVRKCNSDMREDAEKQIDNAEKEAEQWKSSYEESQDRVNELEAEVRSLEQELNDYTHE